MYCKNCGSEIAEGSKFCNHCGSPVEAAVQPEAPKANIHIEPVHSTVHSTTHTTTDNTDAQEAVVREPVFDEFQWNVSDYPDRNTVEKTEEIDFNWNADPASIPDRPSRHVQTQIPLQAAPQEPENVITGADLEKEVFKNTEPAKSPQEMSAAERIDKFYTFNKKNEEFQKLINNEYQRVKSGNAIEHELSQADELAERRFETRPEDSSMEAFLEKEGIVKPYQPKAFQSDVLQRIEAQEAEREAKRLEEEARLAAIEEARREAEAQRKAEEEAMRRAEEEAKRRAEEEAARLEEIARRKAEEEAREAEKARLRAAEEARLRAEAEAKARAEEEARMRAEAEARVKAAEEARLRAEADLKAAQEAAKIRAQQEARLAAEAEAQFKADQEKKRLEAEEAQRRLEEKRRALTEEANQAFAQEEARKVLEHTAKLRAEEEAKIRAAVAGLRSGVTSPVMPEEDEDIAQAHQATRNQISEMARAREAFFAELRDADAAKPAAESFEEKPVTGRETMLSSDDLTKTRVISKADIIAGVNEATRVADVKPAPAPLDDDDFFNSLNAAAEPAAQPIDFKEEAAQPVDDLEDLLSQFEETPAAEPEIEEIPADIPVMDLDQLEQQEKPGLNDTMLMPQQDVQDLPSNDFDSYGNDVMGNSNVAEAANDFYDDGFYDDGYDDDYGDEELSKKEQKQRAKEQKRLEKERAKEEKAARKKEKRDYIEADDDEDESEGGKGRLALKIILVVLIVILAIEVAGMGIRFLAPQSKAAEFVDNQLNKVIQLITGDDTEYSVLAAQARTEPMEDKTELINAQISQNKNGNIDKIVYSADLSYDQETDGKISDLVLSTPMTSVEWGRDEKNYPVYYDEQVVGQIIAYESNLVEYMNKGDENVLSMIDPEKSLYNDIAGLKGQKMSGEFKKLEIGEIRQAGSNYYVWVRETIGDTSTEKVYSMYPEKKFVMKMAACYVV